MTGVLDRLSLRDPLLEAQLASLSEINIKEKKISEKQSKTLQVVIEPLNFIKPHM